MDGTCTCCEIRENSSLLAFYNRSADTFRYHKDLLRYFGDELEGKALWDFLSCTGELTEREAEQMQGMCQRLDENNSFFSKQHWLGNKGMHTITFVYHSGVVAIAFKNAEQEDMGCDELTGLPNRNGFCAALERHMAQAPDGKYAVFFFDVDKFKAINELFGFEEGDRLLMHIAGKLKRFSPPVLIACRTAADHFAFLADVSTCTPEGLISELLSEIESYQLPFAINCNVGVYQITEEGENGNRMLDKAMLAQSTVKGNYTKKIGYYSEGLREAMVSEQEIIGSMNTALAEGQFVVYYQPKYNHSTGMIVGAEALVRWMHPEKGMISPGVFIPIFEKNGFITEIDRFVFEQACRFLRYCRDNGFAMVPISVNFTVDDIYAPDFVEQLERIRSKYDIAPRYLRVEVTERVMIQNDHTVNTVFKKLHDCGYVIELDDFGSGYSSLNVLKDLDVDIIKLDMLFLADGSNGRGGTILSSVINMAKWLKMPVIAEGVETPEQADFLRSIGCEYVQGYLYSKPLPEAEYVKLLSAGTIGKLLPPMEMIDTLDAANFWDPHSQETLIFNNFVGSAAILQYNRATGKSEILRVNQKYLQELGMNLSEQEIIHGENDEFATERDYMVYLQMLNRAIDTMEEQECETWRQIHSSCCGDETICVRSTVRVIGSSGDQYLFYKMIRNVTAEKHHHQSMIDTEKRFMMASEQVNIYFWEYTIATHEMRPCFRCMRDLGLPPLLRNYPESAFEMGVFPPETWDMYRNWHVQIASGVEQLEAVIPLTADRVPFHVRYTTEFDENGHAIKAYGSAALVVD